MFKKTDCKGAIIKGNNVGRSIFLTKTIMFIFVKGVFYEIGAVSLGHSVYSHLLLQV